MGLEKICCGLPLRSACIITGFLEVIVAPILAITLIEQDIAAPRQVIPIAVLDILLVIAVVIGAFNRDDRLLRPYVVVKIAVLRLSGIALVLCILVGILCASRAREDMGMAILAIYALIAGITCATFIVLNIIPALIVRKFRTELMEIGDQEDKTAISYRNL